MKEDTFQFTEIFAHQQKKGKFELKVKWINGEETWEPLNILHEDDPVSVAEYAKQESLLYLKAFKWCNQFLGEHQVHINFIRSLMPANVGKLKRVLKEL